MVAEIRQSRPKAHRAQEQTARLSESDRKKDHSEPRDTHSEPKSAYAAALLSNPAPQLRLVGAEQVGADSRNPANIREPELRSPRLLGKSREQVARLRA